MSGFSYGTALVWIPLLPLAAAVIHGFFGKEADKSVVSALGIGSVAVSFALSVICAMRAFGFVGGDAATLSSAAHAWFPIATGGAPLSIEARLVMDGLSGVMAVMVTGIGLLIHVYSASYMHDDEGFARFFAFLNLFMASMLVLVLASSLPLLFVGWEGVGVCSYLLIGFWHRNPAYAAAAQKAFVMNRIGDLGVLLGLFLLALTTRSVELDAINTIAPMRNADISDFIRLPAVPVAVALLFLGCAGKSAQLPLYTWLPDAMAGPTPVSALIHAATMVTAGVYLACRLSGVFAAAPDVLLGIALIGTATALIAATIALVQNDLKKVLAYSTVSQLGFMFAAIGVGAFSAAIFHVFTHAFFKACLFLGAGSVMHAVGAHGDVDIRRLGGLREKLPITAPTFFVATLAIAGFPLLAGFFSKDAILAGALGLALHGVSTGAAKAAAWTVVVGLGLGSLLTAFYMTRCASLTFLGTYKGLEAGLEAEPHESPRAMTVPLVILAAGAAFAGLLDTGFSEHPAWMRLLGTSTRASVHAHHAHMPAMALGLTAATLGLIGGYLAYVKREGDLVAERLPGRLYRFLADAYRVDGLYDRLVVAPIRALSTYVAAVEEIVLRPLTLQVPALASRLVSEGVLRTQDGYVQTYGLGMAIGLVGVLGFLEYPRVEVEFETQGQNASFTVASGMGQEVRADLDSDGVFETEFGTTTRFDHVYERGDIRGFVLAVNVPPNSLPRRIPLGRQQRDLGADELGPLYRGRAAPGAEPPQLPPRAWYDGTRVHIRPNGEYFASQMSPRGRDVEEAILSPGEQFTLGAVEGRAIPVTRAVFEVRTIFGRTRSVRVDVPLEPGRRAVQRGAGGEGAPTPPGGSDPHAGHGGHP